MLLYSGVNKIVSLVEKYQQNRNLDDKDCAYEMIKTTSEIFQFQKMLTDQIIVYKNKGRKRWLFN